MESRKLKSRYHMLVADFTATNYLQLVKLRINCHSSYMIMGTRRSTEGFLQLVVYIELYDLWTLEKTLSWFYYSKPKVVQLCWEPQTKVIDYCKESGDFLELGDSLPEEEIFVEDLDKPETLFFTLNRTLRSFYVIKYGQKLIKFSQDFLEKGEKVFAKEFLALGTVVIECNGFVHTYNACKNCGEDSVLPPGDCPTCGANLEDP